MADPIRIPLPESIRIRLLELHQQKAQIGRDVKLIVDTLLGTQWAPNDPLWGAAIALDKTELVVTPIDPPKGGA